MINNYPVLSRVGLLFLETAITILSYIVAISLRNAFGLSTDVHWKEYMNLLLTIIIVWGGLSEYQEAYAGSSYKSGRYLSNLKSLKKEISIAFRTVLLGCPLVYLVSIGIGYYTEWIVPKSLILIFGIVNFSMLSFEKILISQYIKHNYKKSKNIRKVLVLGTGDVAKQFLDSIEKNQFDILGFIDKESQTEEKMFYGYKILGNFDSFRKVLHLNYIDELIVALPAKYLGGIEHVIATCDKEGIPVRIISPFFKNLISKARAETIYGFPNIVFLPVERNDLEMAIKRLFDIIISLSALIIMSPLFIIVAVLIKMDSPGPVFYRWNILGLHKRPLISYKFRTMVQDAEDLKKKLLGKNEMKGAAFKIRDDPRITKTGKLLRKYSIDELPQLWSVLKGDLSLIGPRPPLQTEVELYKGWHRRKLSVKPGITCLWQVSGRNEISDFDEWMRLDLKYIDEWSLWLDLKIFFKTIPAVIKGSGR